MKASRKKAQDKVFFISFGKKAIHPLPPKWWHHKKKVMAINLYIGINILMYERRLAVKVWYMAGWPNAFPVQ